MKRLFLLFSILSLVACSHEQPPPPAPPPAPQPAPPPAAQMNDFKVYFGSGSASLTSEARQIVDAAAATAKSSGTPVQVIGHTDAVGSAALNQRLSQRRAQAVAQELARAGVAQNEITVSAVGEQSASGGKSAESRRVEIVLGGAGAPPPPPPGPPGAPPPPAPGS